jgi:hypothetical protein
LCSLQVGWKVLINMFSLLDSCVALPCMAFLLFLPLSNHHDSNVNVLFSNIYIPLKIFGILYTTTFSISHMWPYQIYVWINIIFSNEYWWEMALFKNLKKSFVLCYVDKLFNLQKDKCLKAYS